MRTDWIRYLVRRCLEHRRLVVVSYTGALAAALLTAALPLVVRHVVDTLSATAASVAP